MEYTRVRYRIDGALQKVEEVAKDRHNAMIARIKLMAGMDIAEKRLPQDARFSIRSEDKKYELRAATFPSISGESMTLRILDKSEWRRTLADIEMLPDTDRSFRDVISQPYGLVLVTGPTGSGKSTTLYAALDELNTPSVKVCSVEETVEYDIPGVVQSQVRKSIGLTAANLLRSLMLQDPDVILVGILSDPDTVKIAIQAALTGHLVLACMHTNDAPSALRRLVHFGADPFTMSSAVKAVLAQRLVRKLNPETKEVVETPAVEQHKMEVPSQIYRAAHVNGYKGRTALHELLVMNEEVKMLVAQDASGTQIREAAREAGMRTLIQDGLAKVALGVTTVEQVLPAV